MITNAHTNINGNGRINFFQGLLLAWRFEELREAAAGEKSLSLIQQ